MKIPTSKLRCLFALAGTLAAILTLTSTPLLADDRDILRESTTKPYLFVLLDTSGSMNWAPKCTAAQVAAGDCDYLCPTGDCATPRDGDDPASKFRQAKEALYEVLSEVDGHRPRLRHLQRRRPGGRPTSTGSTKSRRHSRRASSLSSGTSPIRSSARTRSSVRAATAATAGRATTRRRAPRERNGPRTDTNEHLGVCAHRRLAAHGRQPPTPRPLSICGCATGPTIY